jgi:signal transduction histidine kinase
MTTAPESLVQRSARRIVQWASATKPRAHNVRAVVAAIVAVGALGALDYATGTRVSLGVVYLLPATVITVAVGSRAGYLVAALGAVVWTEADAFILHDGALVQLLNVTVRFVILAVVVFLVAALREAATAARASDQRSREFLKVAAHQLRTPVAGLLASAEALTTEQDATRRTRLTRNLATEADRIGHLLRSLLQLSRLEQGAALSGRRQPIEVVCQEEAERVRVRSTHLDVHVRSSSISGDDSVDAEAVREILANLLDNASRHARTRITVDIARDADQLAVRVGDDGPGLPAGTEERVFERFVGLDGHGGAGLGLAIARALAESQGGQLLYEDGAFVLTLPTES